MANLFRKLLKHDSSLRLSASISRQLLPKPAPSLILQQSNQSVGERLDSLINPVIDGNLKSETFSRFYPSSPFGYCLNPVLSSGSDLLAVRKFDEVESSDAGMMYADSVKKKRKKKMNKHKYKKLRKRLRRKT